MKQSIVLLLGSAAVTVFGAYDVNGHIIPQVAVLSAPGQPSRDELARAANVRAQAAKAGIYDMYGNIIPQHPASAPLFRPQPSAQAPPVFKPQPTIPMNPQVAPVQRVVIQPAPVPQYFGTSFVHSHALDEMRVISEISRFMSNIRNTFGAVYKDSNGAIVPAGPGSFEYRTKQLENNICYINAQLSMHEKDTGYFNYFFGASDPNKLKTSVIQAWIERMKKEAFELKELGAKTIIKAYDDELEAVLTSISNWEYKGKYEVNLLMCKINPGQIVNVNDYFSRFTLQVSKIKQEDYETSMFARSFIGSSIGAQCDKSLKKIEEIRTFVKALGM